MSHEILPPHQHHARPGAGAGDAVLRRDAGAGRRSSPAAGSSPAPSAGSASPCRPEGGHYTLVTVETNQVGESEADKLAKRFLTLVHTMAEPDHRPIGAY